MPELYVCNKQLCEDDQDLYGLDEILSSSLILTLFSGENGRCHVMGSVQEYQNFQYGLTPQQASLRARIWL
jgi:hypothetical protein